MSSLVDHGRLAVRTGSAWILALALVACGGEGGEASPDPTPTPPALATDRERTEAAAGAALSLISLTAALVSDAPRAVGAPAAATLQAARELASEPASAGADVATRAVRVPCTGGGTLDGSCGESGGATTVISRSRECELADPSTGLTVVSNGELTARLMATGICRSGIIPTGVPVTYRYRDFRATTSDGDTVVETFDAPMLVQRVEPRPGGCGDGDGLTVYDGGLGLSRLGGTAFELAFSELGLDVRSGGTPCRRMVALSGRVEVSDRAAGHAFAAQPRDATIDLPEGGGRQAAIAGAVSIDCIGTVVYETTAEITAGSPCGLSGTLRIELPSGNGAGVELTAGAVAFDYDGDGTNDASAPSCTDPSLARCAAVD